ncbi:hypothetical protein BU23DRAFT_331170 [Bimuria novae-zelandiae CBS 107.79]|uniref:Uncharacterized protein n=1 Tax=Bimuria novae-zelandiae CBS 107.79 TaxID=1447943 RepID=A0A6A5UQR4_9PLEO|nr:hypothetical protein BU23DRAFT_331170 [Bimuria novae-zelandiae CBS 107.79]
MVQITTSLLGFLAASSFAVAVPNTLEARAPSCHDPGAYLGYPDEAARCINELAALNSVCKTDFAGRMLRKCGKTVIWSVSRVPQGASTPCKNVAASAGLIMDACTRNDGVGDRVLGSAYVIGNGDFWIQIRGDP